MDIQYRTGDLLDAPETLVVHGCNAQGAMNSGVAKAIRARYPQVFAHYKAVFDRRRLRMGEVIWVDCETHIVGNAITQEFYGREPNHRYCSYDAIDNAFSDINQFGIDTGMTAVALPLLGAGLAQGSWGVISRIIEHQCRDIQPVVYTLDGHIPS